MEKVVSIIVPIYNVEAYLNRCIDSILNQTYKSLEIILVDDGSTDHSSTICDTYKDLDGRIEVIHKENGGLVSARKAGLKIATGEYILNVDADDWLENDMVEQLVNFAEREHTDIVCSAYYLNMGDLEKPICNNLPVGKYLSKDLYNRLMYEKTAFRVSINAFVWCKLFRKKMLEQIQFEVDDVISLGEDAAVTYPAILLAESIYVTDYIGYHYVQREGSITNICYKDELVRDRALISHLKKQYISYEDNDILLKQLNQYTKNVLLVRGLNWFDKGQSNKVLMPFGGIEFQKKVIIYGAGKFGQSTYNYLKSFQDIMVIDWLDQAYDMYNKIGYPVNNPEKYTFEENAFDYILISVCEPDLIQVIRKYLMKKGISDKKICSLTDVFISDEYCIMDQFIMEND